MSILLLTLAVQAAGQQVTTVHNQPAQPGQSVSQPALTNDQPAPADDEATGTTAPPPAWARPLPDISPPAQAVPDASAPTAPSPVPTAAPTGPVLWRNITSGMSVADLRAHYPQGADVTYKNDRTVLTNVPIIEGCEAKVNILHPAGVVKEIVMRGEGSLAGRCSLKIITALSAKYGESLEKDKVHGSILARQGKNYVWTRDGITLQFKRYTSGALGGGGLFAASWELRYSATAMNIDL